jgi:hypothetical protein
VKIESAGFHRSPLHRCRGAKQSRSTRKEWRYTLVAYVLVALFFCWLSIFWINQRAVAEKLLPLRQELKPTIEPFNESFFGDQKGELDE